MMTLLIILACLVLVPLLTGLKTTDGVLGTVIWILVILLAVTFIVLFVGMIIFIFGLIFTMF